MDRLLELWRQLDDAEPEILCRPIGSMPWRGHATRARPACTVLAVRPGQILCHPCLTSPGDPGWRLPAGWRRGLSERTALPARVVLFQPAWAFTTACPTSTKDCATTSTRSGDPRRLSPRSSHCSGESRPPDSPCNNSAQLSSPALRRPRSASALWRVAHIPEAQSPYLRCVCARSSWRPPGLGGAGTFPSWADFWICTRRTRTGLFNGSLLWG